MTSIFDQHLPRNEANFAALSPLSFIERTAEVYPDRLAIVHGTLRPPWAQPHEIGAALFELHVAAHDIHHVNAREQFLDERLGDRHPGILNDPARAA